MCEQLYLICSEVGKLFSIKEMKLESLKVDIADAVSKLLEMAEVSCWNTISDNCEFILSEIDVNEELNFFDQRKKRKRLNSLKQTISISQVTEQLEEMYTNLYDVNLHVYRAAKTLTIIEIKYLLKSTIDTEYQKKINDKDPMLHCELPIPPYRKNKIDKYDINWELGGFRHKYNMFW